MASPNPISSPERFGGRVLQSPKNGGRSVMDDVIWKRLREAGFDEETVKRRDKAALIAYVTKLEAEIYDYQCNMGLVLLEKKDLESKYNEIKASYDSTEIKFMHDKAANLSALDEARKREENLKKTLGIEKECLANIEKTLHEMRAESAEIKAAYERKLVETQLMTDAAQKMLEEAKSKAHEAEASQADVSYRQNAALRALQDVEAREDELRRRTASFHSEYEAKEKELEIRRQSLNDSQKILHQGQERFMEGQSLLNQREDHLHQRLEELRLSEKTLMEAKQKFEDDSSTLREERAIFELDVCALAAREENVLKREALLDKKDRELLILQEKISNKEFDEVQRLKAECEQTFERKAREFESEMEQARKLMEDELEVKRSFFSAWEAELKKKEQHVTEMDNLVKKDLYAISEKQEDVKKKLGNLVEKEMALLLTEKRLDSKKQHLQTEKEENSKMQGELQKEKVSLEEKKIEIIHAEEKLAITANERNALIIFERKLKEEIDSFRDQKLKHEDEADKLKSEKERFEAEWDLIDEKREELRKEADRIDEERRSMGIYLRNEVGSLNEMKENLRKQIKKSDESLLREREDFTRKLEREHLDRLIMFHKEKEDFLNDVKSQRKQMEGDICRQKEEVENYLREKEETFEQVKCKELRGIALQKEETAKQLKFVESELRKLDEERREMARDREQRKTEWSEINRFIEELSAQREKLQCQRELLQSDREEINKQIQLLQKLERLNVELESRTLIDSDTNNPVLNYVDLRKATCQEIALFDRTKKFTNNTIDNPPTPMNWLKKFVEVVFKLTPETVSDSDRSQNTLPVGRKRRDFGPTNGYHGSNSNHVQKHLKKLRTNGPAEMERVLRPDDIKDQEYLKPPILKTCSSLVVIRPAAEQVCGDEVKDQQSPER